MSIRSGLQVMLLTILHLVSGAGTSLPAQWAGEAALPFRVGESLEYEVRVARFGRVGSGRMWVEGPFDDRGVRTWRLRFELEAGKGPIRGVDRTSSWIDPRRFATTRFMKEERHPLSRSHESVLIDADSGTWRDGDGPKKKLDAESPLDELSFMYFLRTIPLDRDTTLVFERHFDAARNPTTVHIAAGKELTTAAGTFQTRLITMEVRDPKRYNGTGTIRIYMNAGDCRVPVRIESRMPVFGATTLTLKSVTNVPRSTEPVPC